MGRYVLMPDHIHLFASPGKMPVDFDHWVRYWKSQRTKRDHARGRRLQSDHWDTRLRTWDSYEAKWEYVRYNPVRKGLVAQPEDWPFQGVLHELEWW